MMDGDDDTTIGRGGWILVVLSGLVIFAVLRGLMQYHFVPAALFAAAIALIVLLLLHRLARAVNRYEDEEEARRVRKIVPAAGEAHATISGVEGAVAPGVRAVPVRPEASPVPVPKRPSAKVTPLASVEVAPVILPTPVAAPPAAAPTEAAAEPALPVEPTPPAKPKAEQKARAAAKPKAAKAKGAAKPKAEKAPKPKAEKAPKAKAAKPEGLVRLTAPRDGKPDPLQEIEGIGPALERLVNGMGFYHFDQIAAWTEADVTMVDAEMKTFKGRISRDRWVEQARIIVSEGLEAFRERARTNDY